MDRSTIHKLLSAGTDQAHDGYDRENHFGYRYSRAQSRESQIRADREYHPPFAHLRANSGSLRRGRSEPEVLSHTTEQIRRRPIRGLVHRLEKDATHLSDRRANASDPLRSSTPLCIAGRTACPNESEWRSPVWLRPDRLPPTADAHHRLRL